VGASGASEQAAMSNVAPANSNNFFTILLRVFIPVVFAQSVLTRGGEHSVR